MDPNLEDPKEDLLLRLYAGTYLNNHLPLEALDLNVDAILHKADSDHSNSPACITKPHLVDNSIPIQESIAFFIHEMTSIDLMVHQQHSCKAICTRTVDVFPVHIHEHFIL